MKTFESRTVTAPTEPSGPTVRIMVGWLAAHAAIALVFETSSMAATLHAIVVVGIALWTAVTSPSLHRITMATAYIVASDVLWRMSEAKFFYEGPKYMVVVLLGIAYFRLVRTRRQVALPLLYIVLLLPSIALTMQDHGVFGSREYISFNLSGPASLAAASVFFLQVRMRWAEMRLILITMLGPIVAIAMIATFGTITTNITFGTESVFESSGGFGPNQVATLLGLGVLLCLVLLLRSDGYAERALFFAIGMWCFGQSALTFSRGGVLTFLVAGAIVLIGELAKSNRKGLAMVILGLALLGGLITASRLNTYTGGALDTRFSSLDSNGRTDIADSDYEIFGANPLAGVGPGMAPQSRSEADLAGRLPHTEFTRMLAEHGILGLLAMGMLIAIPLRALLSRTTWWSRTLMLAFTAWSLAGMLHADMRTASSGFIFGLGLSRLASARRPTGQRVPAR